MLLLLLLPPTGGVQLVAHPWPLTIEVTDPARSSEARPPRRFGLAAAISVESTLMTADVDDGLLLFSADEGDENDDVVEGGGLGEYMTCDDDKPFEQDRLDDDSHGVRIMFPEGETDADPGLFRFSIIRDVSVVPQVTLFC